MFLESTSVLSVDYSSSFTPDTLKRFVLSCCVRLDCNVRKQRGCRRCYIYIYEVSNMFTCSLDKI